MKWKRDNFLITDDKESVDIEFVVTALQSSYWAQNRPREVIEKSIRTSAFLSLFDGRRQIGFNRMVSDEATFCWLCDLYIDPEYRGRGLGKWLFKCTLEHPSTRVHIVLLATRDAHELYERYGFYRKECMVVANEPGDGNNRSEN